MFTGKQTLAVLGVPVDTLNMDDVLEEIDKAVIERRSILLSTINSNFLVQSRSNPRFRFSLLASDICTVDGIGMLLLCKLIAARERVSRVSGADIIHRILERRQSRLGRPLRVFFFGGKQGVAELARHKINQLQSPAVCCVGAMSPGFGSMEELSSPESIAAINDARPDFLIVSLGAERGQEWILRNRSALNVPVCAHLGAAVNFVAGSIRRAPVQWQAIGLEWLWRIRQEPALSGRYRHDAKVLLQMALLEAVPRALRNAWDVSVLALRPNPFRASVARRNGVLLLTFSGAAQSSSFDLRARIFARVLAVNLPVTLDRRSLRSMDSAAEGQIMRFQRDMLIRGRTLRVLDPHQPAAQTLDYSAAVTP